jgi:hypothetical protein
MLAALSMWLPGQNICDISDILQRENTGIIIKYVKLKRKITKRKLQGTS